MARKSKNYHVGGTQLLLVTPQSDWVVPAELPDLRAHARIAVDVENRDDGLSAGRGSGWPYMAGHLIGVSAAWPGGALYAPVAHPDTECFPADNVKRWLLDHYRAGVRVVFHHASHDVGWLNAEWGLPAPSLLDDTEAMAAVVDENRLNYSLDHLSKWRGFPGKDETLLREAAAAYGVDPKKEMWKLPARYVGRYAEQDTRATLALADDLDRIIDAEGTREAYQLECDIIPMVHEMRKRGIRVNVEAAAAAQKKIYEMRDEVFAELGQRIGEKVGVEETGRTNWMERIFSIHARDIHIPRTAPTKAFPRGQPSFTAGTTGWMPKNPHWLPTLIVRAEKYHRAAKLFLGEYIIGYAHRGRLHASINQYRGEEGGTRTHRFSYSDPPLQQMTSRDPVLTPLVRGVFEPEEGEAWLKCDYSQQEYRLNVHFSESAGLTKAKEAGDLYRNDPKADFHALVSSWTGVERRSAKDVNFAKSYRAGIPKFAAMINQPEAAAAEIYGLYDRELPFVNQLGEMCQSLAERRGYIRLLDGARLHFDRWEAARKGDNFDEYGRPLAPRALEAARALWSGKRIRRAFCYMAVAQLIQGSAARQTKLWLRNCWREGFVPLLQLHDEFDFSISSQLTGRRIVELGETAVRLTVPVRVDAHYGPNWAEAKYSWDEATQIVRKK